MEADAMTKRKWEDIETGQRRKIASFISANNASSSFGTFRLCRSVAIDIGNNLAGKLMFRCGYCIWKAKYDAENKRFYGFSKFMRYYRLTIFSMVRFDYYGDGMFKVQIFKPNAIECDPPTYEVRDFLTNDKFQIWNQDEFMFDGLSLEFKKNVGIWTFNSYRNYPEYYSSKIYSFDIDPRVYELRLRAELKGIYRKWSTMPFVWLSISEDSWRIEIKWEGDRCVFCDGWLTFVKESGLSAGDTLVLFDNPVKGPNYADVVINKEQDELVRSIDVDSPDFEKSFFKVISKSVLDEGVVVVPKEIKDAYGDKLKRLNKIQVVGKDWFVFYNASSGYISNLGGMLECFNIVEKETIVFTMDATNYILARIYQEDGREIDYVSRMKSAPAKPSKTWIWSVNWDEDETEEAEVKEETNTTTAYNNHRIHLVGEIEELAGNVEDTLEVEAATGSADQETECKQFSTKLKPSNVDRSTHGVHIPKTITPHNRQWEAGEHVTLTTCKGSWKVVIVLSNGGGRFSAGWNKFVGDNKFKKSNTLTFTMIETAEGITFNVAK